MKIKELRRKSKNELKRLLVESREILRKLRFDVANKQLKNVREMRKIKKTIAKILTILKENVKVKISNPKSKC